MCCFKSSTSHTVLFIKLEVQRSNLFQHFTASLLIRRSLRLGLQCPVQRFSSEATTRWTTPLPSFQNITFSVTAKTHYQSLGRLLGLRTDEEEQSHMGTEMTLSWISKRGGGRLQECCFDVAEVSQKLGVICIRGGRGRKIALSALPRIYSCLHNGMNATEQ